MSKSKSLAVKYFQDRVTNRLDGAKSEDVILARAVPTICNMHLREVLFSVKGKMLQRKIKGVELMALADVIDVINDAINIKFESDKSLR